MQKEKRTNNNLSLPAWTGNPVVHKGNSLLNIDPRLPAAPGMTTQKAFTLIELLVVVLIIGILAAVAIPQYQKAVVKARFTQDVAVFNALSKGIDMYLLANGWPSSEIRFTGSGSSVISLDTSLPWISCTGNNCKLPHDEGEWAAHCNANLCHIAVWRSSLAMANLQYKKYPGSSEWLFGGGETEANKQLCSLVRDFYSIDDMDNNLKRDCAALGIQ